MQLKVVAAAVVTIFSQILSLDGHILAHILAATSIGVISATAFHYYHRQKPQKQLEDQTVVPLLDRNESGRVAKLERFSNYVASLMISQVKIAMIGIMAGGEGLDFSSAASEPISYVSGFQALRAMVQANPQILQPMLQELGKQNPHLMRLIQEHQADFVRLINEPVKGGEGQLAAAMPQSVTVTPEEREAIERMEHGSAKMERQE
ncbi:unnamed protein product [Camellia sinensis]